MQFQAGDRVTAGPTMPEQKRRYFTDPTYAVVAVKGTRLFVTDGAMEYDTAAEWWEPAEMALV